MGRSTRKRLEVTVSASVPRGISAAHFRRLVSGQLNSPIYLSIHDQIVADTNVGTIRVTVKAGRRSAT